MGGVESLGGGAQAGPGAWMRDEVAAQEVTPGRIVRFRVPFTDGVWLPALVLVTAESIRAWSDEDGLMAGAWNWPLLEEGTVHLAVFQPVVGGVLTLEPNVPYGDGPGCWQWPEL